MKGLILFVKKIKLKTQFKLSKKTIHIDTILSIQKMSYKVKDIEKFQFMFNQKKEL